MRTLPLVMALLAVAACSPAIPDSAAGVGMDDYSDYRADPLPDATTPEEATRTATGATATGTETTETPEAAEIAAETEAALAAMAANSGEMPVEADPNNPTPETVSAPTGISEENDFDAVDDARTIESDKALIARNREKYRVIEPTSLPSRPGNTGPNIVAYALATNHPVGTKLYTRIGLNKQARFQRNCAKYPSDDQAQLDFLEEGGPERDRLGLDPDGDGYACGWSPEPFRMAVRG